MAQFYFHVWRGGHLTPDEVGVALPSLTDAQGQAERLASSIRDQYEGAPADLSGWDIEITDAAGRTFLIVPVGDRGSGSRRSRAA